MARRDERRGRTPSDAPEEAGAPSQRILRWVTALLLIGLAGWYTEAVLLGTLPAQQKIDGTHLMVIALALLCFGLLVAPEALDRLKLLEIAGLKLELRDVKARLTDISLLLPLLLPEPEQKHLLNLHTGATQGYTGQPALRAELRHLRSIRLIRMKNDKTVGEMGDGRIFNLGDYVELTELGKRWAQRIPEIEQS